mgnify:CR=1 FL=1
MGIFDKIFKREEPEVVSGSKDQRLEAVNDPGAKKMQDAILNYKFPNKNPGISSDELSKEEKEN